MAEENNESQLLFINVSQQICQEIEHIHNNVMQSMSKEIISEAISRIISCIDRLSSFQTSLPNSVSDDFQRYMELCQVFILFWMP